MQTSQKRVQLNLIQQRPITTIFRNISWFDWLLLYLLLLKMSRQCKAGRDWERSINLKTPTKHNQHWKEQNIKYWKTNIADYSIWKGLAPASPISSNTIIKTVPWRYWEAHWEVLQSIGANGWRLATKAPLVIRVDTYGKGSAQQLRGCIRLLLT